MENPLKSLRIKNYYTYLLAIAGLILIISFIYESRIIAQQKLVILCLITIIYGIVEWIRENQFNDYIKQISVEWNACWDESSPKNFKEMTDQNYYANIRKNFKEKYKIDKLLPNYQFKTWVFLIIYFILMFLVLYFM